MLSNFYVLISLLTTNQFTMNKIITLLSLVSLLFIQQGIAQIAEPADLPQQQHATIEFDQDEFNFGTIAQGEMVKNVFTFTNTSDIPLIIVNAKGSCGCTVPEWPREPIMPGESSQLLVVFNSKGKLGSQAKKVSITANTEIANTFLTLKGKVEKNDTKEKASIKNRSVDYDFFKIYPNPAAEYINISLKDYLGEKATIQIFDHSGKLMKTKGLDSIEEKSYRIDLANFNSGIFTATIQVSDKMRLAKQFVIQ